jgi:glycosyltransferase involved in cell wall biosynthesis
MRLALVTPRYLPDIGGIEVHVDNVARRLAAAGHQVEVLTQAAPNLPRLARADDVVIRRFPIIIGGEAYPFAPSLWSYVLRYARQYDVVHMHGYHATVAIPAALAPVQRLVFTPHYLGGGRTALARIAHRPYRSVGRVLFHRADQIVCTTTAEAQMVITDFPNAYPKTTVVPNGIDAEVIRAAETKSYSGPIVLCAGRLETYKNTHLVMRALPFLSASTRLVIVGDGPASKDLLDLAGELDVASRVEFVGAVPWPDVYRWFRAADVFVTMSARESFGMSVLEAHVAGAQLVASDIPPHRELTAMVGSQIALVPLAATATELAGAIRTAATSPKPVIQNVPSWDDHVDSLLLLYASDRDGVSGGPQ